MALTDDERADDLFAQGDASMLTASGDQTVRMWDVETQTLRNIFSGGHSGSIKTLALRGADVSVGGAGHSGAVVFASGSRDGHINLFDQVRIGLGLG